jgi:hypothetical protein
MKNKNFPCAQMLPSGKFGKGMTAIFQRDSIWQPGAKGTISLTFGTTNCQGCDIDAAWSLIGSQSNSQNISMNLGFIDPPNKDFTFKGENFPLELFANEHRNFEEKPNFRAGATVIHEFCHALGMLHEHQNNLNSSNSIHLNPQAVIEYYTENNLGGQEAATINVLDWYSDVSLYEGSKYDPDSIMLYPLPDSFIKPGYPNPTKGNFTLSQLDKQWLMKEYPLSSKNYPHLTVKFIDSESPKWKEAWVVKTITENLAPIVGITWTFVTDYFGTINFTPDSTLRSTRHWPELRFHGILGLHHENFGPDSSCSCSNSTILITVCIILLLLLAIHY